MTAPTRQQLCAGRRWVVKIGSAMITNNGAGLDREQIAAWAAQMATLRAQGHELLLVSSGSIAEGITRLGLKTRPSALHELQAAAAVGQMGLVEAYESAFQTHGLRTAQVLLTHDDASDRQRYLNVRSTLLTLLDFGVIPVINENDTVVNDEIRFGDNDNLGALVANLIDAELFVILTDQRGMYDRDPRSNPDARLIDDARADDPALLTMSGAGGTFGRGGMLTKVQAAAKAARSGTATVIAWGREPDVLTRIAAGDALGSLLRPAQERTAARKRWLAGQLRLRGSLKLDDGAVRVLRESGKSLLPIGVQQVSGTFSRGELVACMDCSGEEVARGLVNYSAAEATRIIGRPSEQIIAALGYSGEPELIHRDNLVVL